jgi:hypothetical protein
MNLGYAWLSLLLLAMCLVIHECGHYIAFRAFKVKPKVRLRWWGVEVGNEEAEYDLTIKQYLVVIYAGILAGIFPLLFAKDSSLVIFYLLMCGLDIMLMFEAVVAGGLKHLDWKVGRLVFESSIDAIRKTERFAG